MALVPSSSSEKQQYVAAPSDECSYGSTDFWDERYLVNSDTFEWYVNYDALRDVLSSPKSSDILIAGCGSSSFGPEMYDDGYASVMNVDVSRIVIEEMRQRYSDEKPQLDPPLKGLPKIFTKNDLGGLQWKQTDCKHMEGIFSSKIFDLVIDKALLDAIECSLVPGTAVTKYLDEIERILTPTGIFICVSHKGPEQRLEKLDDPDPESVTFRSWEVTVTAIPRPKIKSQGLSAILASPPSQKLPPMPSLDEVFFVYICRKTPDLDEKKDHKLLAARAKAQGKAFKKNLKKKKR